MAQTYSQVKVVVGAEEIEIPEVLTKDVSNVNLGIHHSMMLLHYACMVQKELFQSVLSVESLKDVLTDEDKEKLLPLLPNNPSLSLEEGLK